MNHDLFRWQRVVLGGYLTLAVVFIGYGLWTSKLDGEGAGKVVMGLVLNVLMTYTLFVFLNILWLRRRQAGQ